MRLLALIFAILFSCSAHGASVAPLLMESFDDVDDATSTATDVYGLTQHYRGGSASDTSIQAVQQGVASMHTHNGTNGGTSSSLWAGYVTAGSGEYVSWSTMGACTCAADADCGTSGTCSGSGTSRFCVAAPVSINRLSCIADSDCASGQVCQTANGTNGGNAAISSTQIALGWAMHVTTAPTIERVIAEAWMDTDANGYVDTRGTYVTLGTDRVLRIYYGNIAASRCVASGQPASCCTGAGAGASCGGTQTLLGTTAETLENKSCTGSTAAFLHPCTSDGDCTPPETCATSCDTTTGAGCYWGNLEFATTGSGNTIIGEVLVNGRVSVTESPTVVSPSPGIIKDFRLGAPNGEAGTLAAWFDDVVVKKGVRANFGWVGRMVPATDGKSLSLNTNGSGCSSHACYVGDYNRNSFLYDANDLRRQSKQRSDEFFTMGPTFASGGLTIAAIESILIGQTNSTSSGTRSLFQQLFTCTAVGAGPTCTVGAAATETSFTIGTSTKTRTFSQVVLQSGSPVTWTDLTLNQLGIKFGLTEAFTGDGTQFGAAIVYIRGERADQPLLITLRDANKGPEDGKLTVATYGDSLNGGVFSASCSNSAQSCSQQSYCPNIDDGYHAFPTGGCFVNGVANDAICRTCNGRYRLSGGANLGAGYPCTTAGTSECGDAQTCSGGFCSVNDSIPCTTTADCTGLGSCDSTATCTESCPGGECPFRAAWGAALYGRVGFDTLLRCAQQGETPNVMVSGVPTTPNRQGRFFRGLDGNDDHCVADYGSGHCVCTDNSHCGTAGVCTGGVCLDGDPTKVRCVDSTTCATVGGTKICHFDPPDVFTFMEGANDNFTAHGPQCRGAAGHLACPCSGASVSCIADSTCNSGGSKVDDNSICYAGATESVSPSNTPADCLKGEADCVGGSPGSIAPTGYCSAGADGTTTFCVAGYASKNKMCRKTCTPGAGGDAVCAALLGGATCNASGYCNASCTCPSSSRTCSTNADCDGGQLFASLVDQDTWTQHLDGLCVAGHCACTGYNTCGEDPQCAFRYNAYLRGLKGYDFTLQAFDKVNRVVAALVETDKRPLLTYLNYPKWPSAKCGAPVTLWPPLQKYAQITSRKMLADRTRFPNLVDIRRLAIFTDAPTTSCYSDRVHFKNVCADAAGVELANNLNSWNVCADVSVRGQEHAQRYCRNKSGTWSANVCATSGDCTATQSCAIRPCACTCRTTVDCKKFGDAAVCSDTTSMLPCTAGSATCECTRGGDDSCHDLFGGASACDQASGQCLDTGVDACPAYNDTCRVE